MATPDSNVVISAFTEDQVVRLTGVSRRQLRYWATDKFFVPSIKMEDESLAELRLYGFRDLLCLKIISSIRNESKVSFPELRKAKERLAHLGSDMWAKTTLYVHRKKIVFDNPETGQREETSTGQGVLEIPLKVVAGKMEDAVRAMRRRDSESIGKIDDKRGATAKHPVIAGTRIPVRNIQAFHRAGYSIEAIQKQYPSLDAGDIEAAITYKEVA
jgi:DNA-binding transcriptional MerR regulator